MKILVVAPTPFFSDRGTHIRILEEALALEERGHEVCIVTYHIGQELPKSFADRIDVRRIRRLLFWYKKLEAGPDWQKILLDIMLIRKTFNIARTWKPDVIHGHLHEGALIGWIVKNCLFWRRMKLIVDFHGSLTKEMTSHDYLGSGMLRSLFAGVERWIDNLGDRAVASSWENASDISRIRQKNAVIPVLDGVRLSMFCGLSDTVGLRKRYGIPERAVVVSYTGALIPNKGIAFLLEAIPLVVARYPETHFVIAGSPIDQIADYLGKDMFQKHVTVISPLPYFELPGVLALSDIGVDPKEATTRQASGKMLQYMGAGLPIVCFDTENNRRYLDGSGSYASEVSPEALSEAIGILIADEPARQKQGRINRERAAVFSWERSAEELEKIYESA